MTTFLLSWLGINVLFVLWRVVRMIQKRAPEVAIVRVRA